MASTFLSSRYNQVPHSSPAIQMPHVFVVPPEEDQSPTWCCFNASDTPLSTSPDILSLDSALDDIQAKTQALFASAGLDDTAGPFGSHNTTIMPIPTPEHPEAEDDWTDNNSEDTADAQEPPLTFIAHHYRTTAMAAADTNVGNDSDVVEVIKVERPAPESDSQTRVPSPPLMKRSKSLKLRASKVLRSIKIVGKSSSRSKQSAADVPPLPLMPEQCSTPKLNEVASSSNNTPTIPRRKSAIFSQFFSAPAAAVSPPDGPQSSTQDSPPITRQTRSCEYVARPSSPLPDFRHPSTLSLLPEEAEYFGARCPSPSPSMRTFSGKRRFSIMGLQRLFSFPNATDDITRDPPTPVTSRESSGHPTVSSLGPGTPTEERTPLPYQIQLDIESVVKPLGILPVISPPDRETGDISFEMRLDSLHFDALSFDVDRF